MSSFDEFEDADGRVDWDAYHRSQVAKGDECMTCGTYLMNLGLFGPRKTGPQECGTCQELKTSDEEWTDDGRVRCPKCRHAITLSDTDYWESGIYDESDSTTIHCQNDACEFEYEVTTSIRYSFTSPKMIVEN